MRVPDLIDKSSLNTGLALYNILWKKRGEKKGVRDKRCSEACVRVNSIQRSRVEQSVMTIYQGCILMYYRNKWTESDWLCWLSHMICFSPLHHCNNQHVLAILSRVSPADVRSSDGRGTLFNQVTGSSTNSQINQYSLSLFQIIFNNFSLVLTLSPDQISWSSVDIVVHKTRW